jgi:hypothetical protein
MAEPSNEHLRSLLVAFDESLTEIQGLSRLASAHEKEIGEFGAQQSPLALVGRLQRAVPAFEQARTALEAERDRTRRRLQDAEAGLATWAATPRPLPGSREGWVMGVSVREAERESDQARADLGLEMRLGAEIVWDDVRKGLGRAADVAFREYAAYLRGVYLAEAPATLRHAADRVLQARAVYQRTVTS